MSNKADISCIHLLLIFDTLLPEHSTYSECNGVYAIKFLKTGIISM